MRQNQLVSAAESLFVYLNGGQPKVLVFMYFENKKLARLNRYLFRDSSLQEAFMDVCAGVQHGCKKKMRREK